jgi:hypothetical protein
VREIKKNDFFLVLVRFLYILGKSAAQPTVEVVTMIGPAVTPAHQTNETFTFFIAAQFALFFLFFWGGGGQGDNRRKLGA